MIHNPDMYATMPLGVVIRRTPGVTRWAAWAWKAVAVLPGAGPADWRVLREEQDITEYHAATLTLELHGAETEAYLHGLSSRTPSVYVVLRQTTSPECPLDAVLVTASPYEAQDYADNGEDIVEKVPMPEGLAAWVRDFARAYHKEEEFKKRRRDRVDVDRKQDGIGDPRIAQTSDVFRSPTLKRKERLQ
ncbi:DUF3305 domain-containing protein [Roseovarius aestuariivivens]|uniref:DUF3305 domain-containing protein n=1 Tax=Roseovarius aestuariivivens TaxID=1888910 RepID=UPI001FD8E060|nr:DUF3305 domain-containing protein [Roseovarius aestuariivivens]